MVYALVLALVAASSSSRADPPQAISRPNRNAALDYWQGVECLIAHLPNDSTPHDVHFAYLKRLAEGHSTSLDDQASKDIANAGVGLFFLHRGSRAETCDWGLALDELGPADEQGHLAQLPYLSGACCLRARWLFAEDKQREAVGDLVALLQLARHVGREGHDGTRALFSQFLIERQAIEIGATYLPEMKAGDADQLAQRLKSAPREDVFKNFLAVQHAQWVDWPKKIARCARRHGGNWGAYWQEIALRSAWRTEVGDLLRKTVNGNPEELTNLANQAEATFEEAKRLAELPPEEFFRAWGAILKKTADRNLIVSLAGGELEPIYRALLVAEARRELFRSGVLVIRKGPRVLESIDVSCGPLTYRKLENGFELSATRKHGDRDLKLVFGRAGRKPRT
jgi:hypothetical protein